jgi:hypothetical protein
MASLPQFYVYVLARPSGVPFYVGKGKGKRVGAHKYEARSACRCHKCNIIRKIWREGGEVQYRIVFTTDDEQEAYQEEVRQITLYGRGNLCNRTDGGDGASGPPNPEAVKRRNAAIRKAYTDPLKRARLISATKAARSTRASRAKTAERSREMWADPEKRERLARNIKAGRNTPESRAKTSQQTRTMFDNPEYYTEKLAHLERLRSNPEIEARRRANQKAALATPEARQRKSDAMKAVWAKKRKIAS